MGIYPKWNQLSTRERSLINNGCGASWTPKKIKDFINRFFFAWQFHASCGHHDFGYTVGGGELRRWHCDFMLTKAMTRDVFLCFKHKCYINAIIGFGTGIIFSIFVFLFGWTSFSYGQPKSLLYIKQDLKYGGVKSNFIERIKKFRW